MSCSITLSPDAGLCHLPSPFLLERGGVLPIAQLSFELSGPSDAPVVAVLGGISSGRRVAGHSDSSSRGWWADFVGEDKAVDTCCYRVLSVDFLGGPGGSTSAANSDQGASFPAITTGDQARALAYLLEDLGIDSLHALIGSSYGGMVGLAFAASYPERIERLVAISAAASSHPMATAWRSLQRKIVQLGVANGSERESLALARGLAMTTYRSAHEFAERFDSTPICEAGVTTGDGIAFPVESYLSNRGEAFAESFSSDVFLSLSLSIDLHQVDPAQIKTALTLVGVTSDILVPVWQLEQLAAAVPAPCELITIDSRYGHDAFLKEVGQLRPLLASALSASIGSSSPALGDPTVSDSTVSDPTVSDPTVSDSTVSTPGPGTPDLDTHDYSTQEISR